MRKFALGLGCAVMLGTASTSFAAIGNVIFEDFEDYADTAAMSAVWAGFTGTLETEIDYDYDGIPDETNKTALHYGGAVNEITFGTPLVPTTEEWIKLSIDIFDLDSTNDPIVPGNSNNKRMSMGLRSNTGANIIELGYYNSPAHFVHRSVNFDVVNGMTSPNWVAFDLGDDGGEPPNTNNVFQGAGWHRYHVTITPDSQLFEFDQDADGTIDASNEYFDILTTAAGFNSLRFGGPSGISSADGGAHFDNISLDIIAATSSCGTLGLTGDLDCDDFVGITDLNIVLGAWNANVTPGVLLEGDPSGDGFVGIEDLNTVLGNWNAGIPPAASAVPEPTTLALLGLGGIAMLRRRR
jgi:hypothetical protein